MPKFCNCTFCKKREPIINPYNLLQEEYCLKEIHLDFDIRTTALCKFACSKYHKKPTCPPNIPDMEFYQNALREYTKIFAIGCRYPYSDGNFMTHWRNYSTNEIHDLLLTREVSLFKRGYVYAKAFIGGSCKVCPVEACNADLCNIPHKGRVPVEATGINVLSLMKQIGLEYQEPPEDYFWRIGFIFF